MNFNQVQPTLLLLGSFPLLWDIDRGESSWEEDEDKKYGGVLRNAYQMYIHVLIVETLRLRLNYIVAMVLLVSSVDHVDLRCLLMRSTP